MSLVAYDDSGIEETDETDFDGQRCTLIPSTKLLSMEDNIVFQGIDCPFTKLSKKASRARMFKCLNE
jgi:hypothetical protein